MICLLYWDKIKVKVSLFRADNYAPECTRDVTQLTAFFSGGRTCAWRGVTDMMCPTASTARPENNRAYISDISPTKFPETWYPRSMTPLKSNTLRCSRISPRRCRQNQWRHDELFRELKLASPPVFFFLRVFLLTSRAFSRQEWYFWYCEMVAYQYEKNSFSLKEFLYISSIYIRISNKVSCSL